MNLGIGGAHLMPSVVVAPLRDVSGEPRLWMSPPKRRPAMPDTAVLLAVFYLLHRTAVLTTFVSIDAS
jgi:hypothetical protein